MSKHGFKSFFEARFKVDTTDAMSVKRIEIPRIQRDYAQGRTVKKGNSKGLNNQGQKFIDSIFSHLSGGVPMEMDFIYGAFENGKFIPLDGPSKDSQHSIFSTGTSGIENLRMRLTYARF